VAIARWPLSEQSFNLRPRAAVEVRRHAVLTAQYDGVARWPKLKSAEVEAETIVAAYPPMAVVRPLWSEVVSCLEGEPPVDLLHVALHGQFDQQGLEDGLVLLRIDEGGNTVAEFLTARQVRALRLETHPFIFLNACQVGAGNEVLGSYAGMATSILRAGARAVIAPLWNIDDDVAAAITATFYATAYGKDPPPVAEILRRIRAQYTEAAVGTAGVTPTLIAYQLFGHPRLRLHRITDSS
jgi:CHAT domain-containing protein